MRTGRARAWDEQDAWCDGGCSAALAGLGGLTAEEPTPLGSGKAPAKRTPYSPSSTFERGEWIEHPKFGAGLVTEKLDGPCVRVAFSDEGRVLVHARA